jgi:molecular chaperone GrpE
MDKTEKNREFPPHEESSRSDDGAETSPGEAQRMEGEESSSEREPERPTDDHQTREIPNELQENLPEEVEAVAGDELDALRKEAEEYLDGWQRARAEFANYKRRTERDMAQIRQHVKGDVLVQILPILDDLERALRDRPVEGESASWASGIELIYRKLLAVVESEGVEEIEAQGDSFDPNYHEALSHEESDQHQEGEIIDVLQKGYRMGDRVLRPALVRVAK